MPVPSQRPRLLVVNAYYRPGVEATARVLTELCETLAGEWEVTVVAAPVAGAAGAGRECRNGVDVLRVRSGAFGRRRRALRALDYLSYLAVGPLAAARERPPDVVLTMTDPPLVGVVAAAVAGRHGAPLVVVSQDVFPEVAEALGQLPGWAPAGLLRRLSAVPLRRAVRVVAIGETMRARLLAKGAPADRTVVIPNWADADAGAGAPAARRNAWSRAHGLDDRFVVMHAGNVGYAQDLETLVRAAALIGDAAQVVVVGTGARQARLAALARSEGADVRFVPYQSPELLSQVLAAADVHAVGLARGLAGLVVPSRLYGVLMAARPVVVHAEEESEAAQVVRASGCGLVVPPGDPAALAAAICEARSLELDRLGQRARAWAEAHARREDGVARYRALLAEVRSAAGAR